jgi:hypothetical protein
MYPTPLTPSTLFSPDIPMNYFFWGYARVKGQIFRPKVCSVVELCAWVNSEAPSVTPLMLDNTWREIQYRLDVLPATNGSHIEMYST